MIGSGRRRRLYAKGARVIAQASKRGYLAGYFAGADEALKGLTSLLDNETPCSGEDLETAVREWIAKQRHFGDQVEAEVRDRLQPDAQPATE